MCIASIKAVKSRYNSDFLLKFISFTDVTISRAFWKRGLSFSPLGFLVWFVFSHSVPGMVGCAAVFCKPDLTCYL